MKKNIIIISTLLLSIFASSCNDDFIGEARDYAIWGDEAFENEISTNWYIARMYQDFLGGFTSPQKGTLALWVDRSGWTEEKGGMENYINPNKEFLNCDDTPYGSYYGAKISTSPVNSCYTRIKNCNIVINNLDQLSKGKLAQSFRNTAKGQMYFFRAWQYFDLVRMFGGVPLVTQVEKANYEDTSIKHPRATVEECVKQIIEDLDSAASKLPAKWDADNYGRFTRDAAIAMKSRVLLTFASPLFNSDWDNPGNERWQAALKVGLEAETQLTTDGYGLYGSSAKDWNNMFLVDNKFCNEAIIVRLLANTSSNEGVTAANNAWENSIRLKSQGGSGGLIATQEMINLFPMADGSNPTAANGYDSNPETNYSTFFLNRDPRFYRTFAFSGCKWANKSNQNDVAWAFRYIVRSYSNPTTTGYQYSKQNDKNSLAFVCKMSNPGADDTAFGASGTDIFEYRYAELLLNIAECYAATNNIEKCIEYIGKVRSRVGIPSTNNYGLGTLSDKYQALNAVLHERQIELAYEGKRFYDIQRWMLYDGGESFNENTCQKLGLTPLNGTSRHSYYLQYKDTLSQKPVINDITGKTQYIATDTLALGNLGFAINPDSKTFSADLTKLSQFYKANFVSADLDTPLDNDGKKNEITILWRPRYYIWGLKRDVLSANDWITQTIGWADATGANGTYTFR
jgi:SusD family.